MLLITKYFYFQADESLQLAVDDYHRANGVHRAAKETIRLMEQSLNEIGGKQDGVSEAWQESIRRNVKRLQEAEQERFEIEINLDYKKLMMI